MASQRYIKVLYGIFALALIFLILVTYFNPEPPLFDEVLFVRNMKLFKQYGLSVKFLMEMYDQAPGPLYQIVQSFFEPITSLRTPGIRLVNVFLFCLIIANTYFILRLASDRDNKLLISLNLLAVPVVWQVAGMALTEIPAMFFATLSLLILSVLTKRDKDLSVGNIVLAFAAGTCLGGAILGRTPYLMLVPASLFLAYNPLADKFNRNSLPLLLMAIFVISCLAICTPVFLIWKGLVPPYQAIISQGGLKIWHGVLGFSYAGIIAALLVPQWFSMSKKIALALIITFLLFCVLNLLWWKVEYMPLYFFLAGILPASSMKIYPFIISPLLMVFSTYFLITLLIHVLRNRNNSYYLMMAASLVLVLATCVNIKHLFSSRYVAQIAPFLVILLAEKDTQDKYKIFRVLVGIIVGYISLQTYANP